jgi:hypothetical protein
LGLGRVTQLGKSGCGGSSFLGADDLTGITHIEVDVWVIFRRLSPNALKLAAANAARGLGTRSMTQSAVHGSPSEGSISTR